MDFVIRQIMFLLNSDFLCVGFVRPMGSPFSYVGFKGN